MWFVIRSGKTEGKGPSAQINPSLTPPPPPRPAPPPTRKPSTQNPKILCRQAEALSVSGFWREGPVEGGEVKGLGFRVRQRETTLGAWA